VNPQQRGSRGYENPPPQRGPRTFMRGRKLVASTNSCPRVLGCTGTPEKGQILAPWARSGDRPLRHLRMCILIPKSCYRLSLIIASWQGKGFAVITLARPRGGALASQIHDRTRGRKSHNQCTIWPAPLGKVIDIPLLRLSLQGCNAPTKFANLGCARCPASRRLAPRRIPPPPPQDTKPSLKQSYVHGTRGAGEDMSGILVSERETGGASYQDPNWSI
jgi:hypothetical protein